MPNRDRVRKVINRRAAGPPPEWYRLGSIRNEVVGARGDAEEPATRASADVYVFESIGGWFGMTADDFVRDVAGLDVDHIDMHINSPGGDVFEAVAMANVLRQHRADVTVWVDGIAASAASVVAMAGDQIVMSSGAQLMIHDALSYGVGNAADLRKEASVLDSVSNSIAGTYAARAGGSPEDWRSTMIAETWYTAAEAVTAGLADRLATDADKGQASGEQVVPGGSTGGMWDDWWDSVSDADRHAATVRSLYAHAGRADAPTPWMPAKTARTTQTPAASAVGSDRPTEGSPAVAFTDEQLTTMRQQLGVAQDADEATILAALTEALEERAEPENANTGLPAGIVSIDATQLATLQTDAAAGREARLQQQAEHRERVVATAVREGRIPPARREHWLAQLVADPGAEQALAGLAQVVPLAETGHDVGVTDVSTPHTPEATRESLAYKNWSF